jgi:transcription elongation factor Elf1
MPTRPDAPARQNERRSMPNVDAHIVKFQCPNCGHDLEQNIGRLKSAEHMQRSACGIGINVDTDRLANAADEIHKAIEKVPPEITIKFFR